jgi:hypothetical protein
LTPPAAAIALDVTRGTNANAAVAAIMTVRIATVCCWFIVNDFIENKL